MTSPYEYMKNNWVLFGISAGDETETMWRFMKQHGITPKEFIIYGNFRAFLIACGLPTDEPIAFHRGTYVGTMQDLEKYLWRDGEGMKIHEANAG